MEKNRPKDITYRPSQLQFWVIRSLFTTIYKENYDWTPKTTVRKSEYDCMSFEEKLSVRNVVDDEKYTEPKPLKLWSNTVSGITEILQETAQQLIDHPKINASNVRNILDKLCPENESNATGNETPLVKKAGFHNQYHYYPNETLEGFVGFLKLYFELEGISDGGMNLHLHNMLSSRYYRIMMCRQTILNNLKKNNVRLSYSLDFYEKGKDDIIESYRIENVPVLGRYVKIYEMHDYLDDYIATIDGLLKKLSSTNTLIVSDIFNYLFPEKYNNLLQKDQVYSEPKCVSKCIDFISQWIEYLKIFSKTMKNMDKFSKDGIFNNDFQVNKQFTEDSGFVLRREALWEDMELSDEESDIIRNCSISRIDTKSKEPISQRIKDAFAEQYVRIIEERVVLPILCLIELSPSALKRFFLVPEAIRNLSFTLDTRDSGFALELDRLMVDALRDRLNNRTLYGTSEYMVNLKQSKTVLYRLGEVSAKEQALPALFTFRINDGRYLSMYHSFHFDPIKKEADYFPPPKSVPSRWYPTYMHGSKLRSTEWLLDMFDDYLKLYHEDKKTSVLTN